LPSSAGWYRRLTLEVAHPAEKSMRGRLEKSIPLPERVAAVLAVSSWPADRAGWTSCFPGRQRRIHESRGLTVLAVRKL
jgi:hypothetical protein